MSSLGGTTRRRLVSLGSLALTAAVFAFLLFGPSDERRVLSTLKELAAAVSSLPREAEAVRQKRVVSALARLATQDVTLSAPELDNVEGREALAELMGLLRGLALEVRIEQSDVRIHGERATATLLLSIVTKVPSEERRQQRTLVAELAREDGEFVVRKLSLSSISREQPEARP